MKNIKELGKKLLDEAKNLVLETKGGEMPDPDKKPEESASEAAKVFESKKEKLIDRANGELVIDDDEDREIDQKSEKKAG